METIDRRKNDILYQILNNLDAYIFVSDLDTHEILYINKKLIELFEFVDIPGQTCYNALKKNFSKQCDSCPVTKLKKDPHTPIVWEEYNSVLGRYFLHTDSLIEWHDGKTVHMQHSVDITSVKEAETEKEALRKNLEYALHDAENANKAKAEFILRMGHELRTPMNAVIGFTRIAKTTDDCEKIKNYLEKIDNSSKQLLELINDILDLSEIEADKLKLNCEVFNFKKMLADICSIMFVKLNEKNQTLKTNFAKELSNFRGDSKRLTQAVLNILTNASKFSPAESQILFDVKILKCENDKTCFEFCITDKGIGISKETMANLFTPFEQADGGMSRKFGGTGLGLSITKKIINMMGGEIFIESEEGKGTKVTFCVVLDSCSHNH